MSLLIKSGHIIDPAHGRDEQLDILIKDGLIAKIGHNLTGDEIIDVSGMYVNPGFIDVHVHFREPGQEHKETIATGSQAAARGGFTSVICMPNTEPPIDNPAIAEFIHRQGQAHDLCQVYCFGTITKGRKGEEISPMAELAAAGVVGFSDDGSTICSGEVTRRALEYAGMLNLPLSVHCEDKALAGKGVMHEGYMSTVLGLPGIPSSAENIIIAREIELARITGGHIHINHVSTKEGVGLIRQAKQAGINVTGEVTPHHLSLTDEIVAGYDTNTKVSPPIRTKEDQDALIKGLQDGTIDCIATDHAPHAREDKEVEYDYAACGLIGLETAWPVVYTHLVEPGFLSLSQAVEKLTVGPSRIFNLPGGQIKEGQRADLTIWDPKLEQVVHGEIFRGKGKNSPFLGQKLRGWPIYTIFGGKFSWRQV